MLMVNTSDGRTLEVEDAYTYVLEPLGWEAREPQPKPKTTTRRKKAQD